MNNIILYILLFLIGFIFYNVLHYKERFTISIQEELVDSGVSQDDSWVTYISNFLSDLQESIFDPALQDIALNKATGGLCRVVDPLSMYDMIYIAQLSYIHGLGEMAAPELLEAAAADGASWYLPRMIPIVLGGTTIANRVECSTPNIIPDTYNYMLGVYENFSLFEDFYKKWPNARWISQIGCVDVSSEHDPGLWAPVGLVAAYVDLRMTGGPFSLILGTFVTTLIWLSTLLVSFGIVAGSHTIYNVLKICYGSTFDTDIQIAMRNHGERIRSAAHHNFLGGDDPLLQPYRGRKSPRKFSDIIPYIKETISKNAKKLDRESKEMIIQTKKHSKIRTKTEEEITITVKSVINHKDLEDAYNMGEIKPYLYDKNKELSNSQIQYFAFFLHVLEKKKTKSSQLKNIFNYVSGNHGKLPHNWTKDNIEILKAVNIVINIP